MIPRRRVFQFTGVFATRFGSNRLDGTEIDQSKNLGSISRLVFLTYRQTLD